MLKAVVKRLSAIIHCVQNSFKRSPDNAEVRDPLEHNTVERIDELYSNPAVVAQYIDAPRIAFYKEVIEICVAKGISLEQKKIADVGCGTGHLLKFIGEQYDVRSLTGFEFSEAALTVAKTVCKAASFHKYDLYHKPEHSFDVVFCTEVLEHLLHPDKAMKSCLEMLVSGGVLMVAVPDGRKDTFLGHINFWSPESWRVFIGSQCKEYEYETGQINSGSNYAIIRQERDRQAG